MQGQQGTPGSNPDDVVDADSTDGKKA